MAIDHFSAECQNCGSTLQVERLRCPECNLVLDGKIQLPRLARLNPKEREFIELFVLSAGSLKEVGRVLGLSYPTVRNQLDNIIGHLQDLEEHSKRQRLNIIRMVEDKEISLEAAAALLCNI
ncbi:MAG: DUF2089 family protein [Victivallaceae bacterium]